MAFCSCMWWFVFNLNDSEPDAFSPFQPFRRTIIFSFFGSYIFTTLIRALWFSSVHSLRLSPSLSHGHLFDRTSRPTKVNSMRQVQGKPDDTANRGLHWYRDQVLRVSTSYTNPSLQTSDGRCLCLQNNSGDQQLKLYPSRNMDVRKWGVIVHQITEPC